MTYKRTLDEIIESQVDERMYLTKSQCEKLKYLKNSLDECCTIDGEDVYIYRSDVKPPRILKIKRTNEEKRMRSLYGDSGVKFGRGKYLDVTHDGYSNTLTTFNVDNYVWDRNFRIRELTTKESFRLMGLSEEDIEIIQSVIPKSQQKKLAGNSICVNVLSEIFRKLYVDTDEHPEPNHLF